MEVKRKLSEFLKRETVLTVAILLAIVSAVMIPPDREYAGYIDFRTLSILFCLMTVMAGLQKLGVFRNIAKNAVAAYTEYHTVGRGIGTFVFHFQYDHHQ